MNMMPPKKEIERTRAEGRDSKTRGLRSVTGRAPLVPSSIHDWPILSMGNASSRNDHYPIPPGYMPPVYPGYPQFSTPTTWNPFKRSQMRKREKALREYLYTTPMILQYPGAFAVTQPGQNLVQSGIPQVHSAVPVAPITATNMAAQMSVPIAAPMMVSSAAPLGPTDGGAAGAAAPVIPSQMVPITYPATYDYAPFLDPRAATAPVIPRRSRRSQRHRHHNHHHRSRRRSRSPTPSTGSSASDTDSRYSSPSSYDSPDYSRYHREHNPLPRPPKDILASTPFRPLLTQLPSAQYNSWGLRGTSVPVSQAQQPQQTTYGNIRPRKQRRGLFNLRPRDQFPGSSLSAAANTLARPFMPGRMSMPEAHPAPPPPPAGFATGPPVPPVIPSSPQMRMPSPEPVMSSAPPPPPQGPPPVIPPGSMTNMPSPAPPGSTPFIGAGLPTPRTPGRLGRCQYPSPVRRCR
ncbi:hypothetical protein BJV74DRAFT_142798 [Russula compacta]|nr:hypothetical protein BJV74DRAFT_142798 [Russula compacta]